MTSYSLYNHASAGPALVSYTSTPFQSGITFKVTSGGMWFEGYWWWVPAGSGDTAAQKFTLYMLNATKAGVLIPAATVTSGTLTAGSWNFVALATPIQLPVGLAFTAQTAFGNPHCVSGFPDTNNVFLTSPVVSGPLTAYSDQGGSLPAPYSMPQGSFGTATSDPAAGLASGSSNSANFGIDVQVGDTAPVGYSGTWEIWPNAVTATPATVVDTTVGDEVSTEFSLSQPCTLQKVRYYSPPGAAVLAGYAEVYAITGADSGTLMEGLASPSWSGAAASGWVTASFSGTVTLPAGDYKVVVGNSSGSEWSAKDSSSGYWTTGDGAAGITWGPVAVPNAAGASQSFVFDGAGGGNTPPFSDGSGTKTTSPSTFAMSGPQFPYLSTGSSPSQNYWVSPVVSVASSLSGTGSAAVSLGASGSGAPAKAGAGSVVVALSAHAAGASHRSGTGTAVLSLAAAAAAQAPAQVKRGSWWQLDSVLKERAEYANYYRSQVPVACPNDGTPLLEGPPQEPAVLYCPMGDWQYPRDFDPIVHSGM